MAKEKVNPARPAPVESRPVVKSESAKPVVNSEQQDEPKSEKLSPAKVPLFYKVTCKCPTPLRENPLIVEAGSKEDAVAKFKKHNGISATEHEISCEPV